MTKNTANSNACSWGTSRHSSIGSISRWLACSALLLLSVNVHANPKLYVFDCGLLSFDDISLFSVTNEETEVRDMFVPCYLIEHDEGRLLWDSGLPIDLAGGDIVNRGPGVRMRYDVSILDQLASMDRVERLLEETAATLWIEHNLELADRLRKAPGFYD